MDPQAEIEDQAPDTFDALASAYTETEPERPHYPAWLYDTNGKFKRPRQPSEKTFKAWIENDSKDWQQVVSQDLRYIRFYRGTHVGVFDSDLTNFEQEFSSPEPRVQTDTLCAIIDGIGIKIRAKSSTKEQQEHARAKEHACRYILAMIQDYYALNGSGSFIKDLVWYFATLGRVAILVTTDRNDPEFPFNIRLLNPSQVFVTQGSDKYGLIRAVIKEKLSVQECLDRFDPGGHNKLIGRFKAKKMDIEDQRTEHDLNTVYTRWHTYVSYGDVTINEPKEHGQGMVPIIFQGHMAEPLTAEISAVKEGRTKREVLQGQVWDGSGNSKSYDLQYRFGRFLQPAYDVIRVDEAMMGLMMTQMLIDAAPPMISESPYGEKNNHFDWRPGAVNPRRPGERDTPAVPGGRSNANMLMASRLNNMLQKTLLPDQLMGAPGDENVSGFHENALIASAKQRLNPYIKDIETTVRMVLERCLYLFHGWGYLYVGSTGEWRVPTGYKDSQQPPDINSLLPMPQFGVMEEREAYPPDVFLDREALEACGTSIEVELHRIDWRELTTVSNAVGILIDKGLWSRDRGMEHVDVEDVKIESQKIMADQAAKNPEFMEKVIIPQMIWQQDEDAYLNWFLTMQLPQIMQMRQQMMQAMGPQAPAMGQPPGQGGPPPMGGPAGGAAPPGQGSVQGIQTVQGDSQPAIMEAGSPGIPRMGPEPSPAMPIS